MKVIEVSFEDSFYEVNQRLDGSWTVWKDGSVEPYVVSPSGSCTCPQFVYRIKRGKCSKHCQIVTTPP